MPGLRRSAKDLAKIIVYFNSETTALHVAAKEGTLHEVKDLTDVTAELLALVGNGRMSALQIAAQHGHLDQVPDLTMDMLIASEILQEALGQPLAFLQMDLRANGAEYNHDSTIRRTLISVATEFRNFKVEEQVNVRAALSAAHEGGFEFPPEALANLL